MEHDWNWEFDMLKEWLDYHIDLHTKELLEKDRVKSLTFKQMTKGFRTVTDYKKNELNFDEWKIFKIHKLQHKKPFTYTI